MNKSASRKHFLLQPALGLGGLLVTRPAQNKTAINYLQVPTVIEKPLKIICAGVHPGDPQFGCGGTTAKYSQAGHKITFL